jgi:hypothetical protein
MVFFSGQALAASIPESNVIGNCADPVHPVPGKNNPSYSSVQHKDSLLALLTVDNESIKTRFTQLKSSDNCGDTIRKSSDKNINLLNSNSLTSLKSRGENNFFTRNLFSLIIRENQPVKEQIKVNSTLYFAPFAGRKIGRIRIQQLDVFGPTLQDTTRRASGWIEKTGNAIHMKTIEKKLMGQLLFNPGETVNPQLMAENEKFIRELPYIQDVAILLSCSEVDDDLVDVVVVIKEKFEYGVSGNLSSNSTEWEVTDQNMFGIGHQFSAGMGYYLSETPRWQGSFKYEISDFDRKFIRTGIGYTNTYRKKAVNAFAEKKFIATKEDWAGGLFLERVFSDHYLTPYSYTKTDTAASYFNSDLWYGHQINNNYSLLGNTIITGRYFHQNFYNNESKQFTNSLLRNHDFILGAIGLSKRYLFKNNRVYGYGITEDIPYGRYAELAAGLDVEKNGSRPYFHFNYSKANILKGGAYFRWQAGVGGFLNDSQIKQGAIVLSTNYFSNFVYLNRHPYRYFINMELLSGINRRDEEYLVINRRFGIRDYFSTDTRGINRLKINIESVRFWNWNKSGFKFAHYFFGDAAFLSDDLRNMFGDKFYAGIGAGIRVHNESLVFNVLEIRFSWIPIAPAGHNPFIFNAFGQPKARFNDFLGGKPQEILYQ